MVTYFDIIRKKIIDNSLKPVIFKQMKPEEFTFTITKKLADANGEPIKLGSVLEKNGEVGVVFKIIREGDEGGLACCVGDIAVRMSSNVSTYSNQYDSWKHVPHDRQTHEQRYLSWLYAGGECYVSDGESKDEMKAVYGILNLFPDGYFNWEYIDFPLNIEQALRILAKYLDYLISE